MAHQSNGDTDSSTNWLADNAPWFDDIIQILYSNPATATVVTSLVAGGTVALIFVLCDFGRKRWFGGPGRGKRKPAKSRQWRGAPALPARGALAGGAIPRSCGCVTRRAGIPLLGVPAWPERSPASAGRRTRRMLRNGSRRANARSGRHCYAPTCPDAARSGPSGQAAAGILPRRCPHGVNACQIAGGWAAKSDHIAGRRGGNHLGAAPLRRASVDIYGLHTVLCGCVPEPGGALNVRAGRRLGAACCAPVGLGCGACGGKYLASPPAHSVDRTAVRDSWRPALSGTVTNPGHARRSSLGNSMNAPEFRASAGRMKKPPPPGEPNGLAGCHGNAVFTASRPPARLRPHHAPFRRDTPASAPHGVPFGHRIYGAAPVSPMSPSRSSLAAGLRGMGLAFACGRPVLFGARLSVGGSHSMLGSLYSMAGIVRGRHVQAANPHAAGESSHSVMALSGGVNPFLRPPVDPPVRVCTHHAGQPAARGRIRLPHPPRCGPHAHSIFVQPVGPRDDPGPARPLLPDGQAESLEAHVRGKVAISGTASSRLRLFFGGGFWHGIL